MLIRMFLNDSLLLTVFKTLIYGLPNYRQEPTGTDKNRQEVKIENYAINSQMYQFKIIILGISYLKKLIFLF